MLEVINRIEEFFVRMFDKVNELLELSRVHRREKKVCAGCERLMHLLEIKQRENRELFEFVTSSITSREPEAAIDMSEMKPIARKTWAQIRFELEQADAKKARETRMRAQVNSKDTEVVNS